MKVEIGVNVGLRGGKGGEYSPTPEDFDERPPRMRGVDPQPPEVSCFVPYFLWMTGR